MVDSCSVQRAGCSPWRATGLMLLATAACGGGDAGVSAASVRDSAGITIVENSGDGSTWADRQPWVVEDEPRVDIGTLEGDDPYQLFRVTGAIRLPDGRIVIANSGSSELRVFDGDGRFLMSSGRNGSGPGEFEQLTWVAAPTGDSIVAFDSRLRRLSVFDLQGRFVRSFQLTTPGERQFPMARGLFDDGKVLVVTLNLFGESGPADGYQRRSDTYQVFGNSGEMESEIGSFLGPETFMRSGREGANTFIAIMQIPFGHSPSATTAGAHLVYGSSDTYEYRVYGRDGALVRIVRREFQPTPVTDADFAAFVDRAVERSDGEQTRADVEERFADMPLPSTMPAYDDIECDTDGNVWVREFAAYDSGPRTWTVFDPEGRMRGSLTVPAGVGVLQIGDDYLLGRWSDDLDVEHVRMYRIVKGGDYS